MDCGVVGKKNFFFLEKCLLWVKINFLVEMSRSSLKKFVFFLDLNAEKFVGTKVG